MGQQADSTRAPSQDSPAGRDAQGRFTKGNRGGPGNPFARQMAALRRTFIEAVSHEELRYICQRLVAQAMVGDVPSIKLLLGYVLGKVPEPVNPDTLDQQECKQYLDDPTYAETEETYQRRPPADLSAAMMRAFHLVQMQEARQSFRPAPEAAPGEPEAAPGRSEPTTPPGPDGTGSPEARTRHVKRAPSPNGVNGVAEAAPSTNGDDGPAIRRKAGAPSPNRDNGRRRRR